MKGAWFPEKFFVFSHLFRKLAVVKFNRGMEASLQSTRGNLSLRQGENIVFTVNNCPYWDLWVILKKLSTNGEGKTYVGV